MARPLNMVDCHAHLTDDMFAEDIIEVIARAKQAGVSSAIVVAENVHDFDKVLDLTQRYPDFIQPCLGIHPVQTMEDDAGSSKRSATMKDFEDALEKLQASVTHLVGIGEVGLDFTPRWCPDQASKDTQIAVLTAQVRLAQAHDLPVNVHSRSAGRPTIALLRELGAQRVHLHAFDGRTHYALQAAQHGYFLSIPPCVLRSEQTQKLVKALPLDNLLLETDSPVLGPTNLERNEPCNVKMVCEYIAQVKGLDASMVADITTANARKVYSHLNLS